MTILQIGMAKSGNYWLYKILQSVIREARLPNHSFIQQQPIYPLAKTWELSYPDQADIDVIDISPKGCFYRISSNFRMLIKDFDDYVRQCSHVWTHSTFCENSLVYLPKFQHVIYVIRDPRDVAVSKARFAFTPYRMTYYPHGYTDLEDFLTHRLEEHLRNWVKHTSSYLSNKDICNIHVVFYERLLYAFDQEISDLLAYLGVELDMPAIERIRHKVSFETMKDESPGHVQRGRWGQWVDNLTNTQNKQAHSIAGPMLRLLNYPLDAVELPTNGQSVTMLPVLPSPLTGEQVRLAATPTPKSLLSRVKRVIR